VAGRWRSEEVALGGWWRLEEAAGPVTSRAIGASWVADRHCVDDDDGGRWLGDDVEEPGCAGDRGGTDRGVEDGWGNNYLVNMYSPQIIRKSTKVLLDAQKPCTTQSLHSSYKKPWTTNDIRN
jgi:hypothetical protein